MPEAKANCRDPSATEFVSDGISFVSDGNRFVSDGIPFVSDGTYSSATEHLSTGLLAEISSIFAR